MSNEIRQCFESYITYMKDNHLKALNMSCLEEVPLMTNSQIGLELDVIHLQYILSNTFSISENTPAFVAYKHLKKMIDSNDLNQKCLKLEINLINAMQEVESLREQINAFTLGAEVETEMQPEVEIIQPVAPIKSKWFFQS